MPSSFNGSDQAGGDSHDGSIEQFNDDHVGKDQSSGLSSFSNLDDFESIKDPAAEDFPVFTLPGSPSVLPMYESSGGLDSKTVNFSQEGYVNAVESSYVAMDDPILPPPAEMLPEEGYALREWRRQNAIRLEEKEKIEKESLIQIIDEAEEYKIEFYKKREVACAANKFLKRDNEKLFISSLEKFHAEADKSYWKAIAELIPNEVPKIERRGKKEQDNTNNKPSVVVVQGPKPGKPSDLSRMRQILVKLKHNPPTHLTQSPPPVEPNDVKPETAIAAV